MTPRAELAPNGKPYESVWEYPRPPLLERVEWRVRVVHGGATIADAPRAWRVLETSQPPAYYIERAFVDDSHFEASPSSTFCEWKGMASYVDIVTGGERTVDAGWFYSTPSAPFEAITGCYAFYAQKLDACYVDGEQVNANDGTFYGGWITANIAGPFKGGPGTSHW